MSVPRRSSSRLKSLLPVDYRIPGDNRMLSPGRSRSRSRPRIDTPFHSNQPINHSTNQSINQSNLPFDIAEEDRDVLDLTDHSNMIDPAVDDADAEDDGFSIRRSSSKSLTEAANQSIKRRTRSTRSSMQLDDSVLTTDAGGSTAEENDLVDETPSRRSRRTTRTLRQSPSPLRDVIQSVGQSIGQSISNAAGSVAHALSSVSEDRQPEEMNGDDTEDHIPTFRQSLAQSVSKSVSRAESPFSIEVSPPESQAPIYSDNQSINQPDAHALAQSAHSDALTVESKSVDHSNNQPGWLLPFIILLTALLAAAGYQFLPSLLESSAQTDKLSIPGLSSEHLQSLKQSIEHYIANSKMMSKSEFVSIYDSVRTDIDEIEHSLKTRYQDFVSELAEQDSKHEKHDRSIKQMQKEFDEKLESVTSRVTDSVTNQLTDRITTLLGDSAEAQSHAVKALKEDVERWTNGELNQLRVDYSRMLTEKLAQVQSSTSSAGSDKVTDGKVHLDESEIHSLLDGVQDTLLKQINQQIQKVDQRIEKALESFVTHAELTELASELRASVARQSSDPQESAIYSHELKELETRVIRLVDEKLDAVKSSASPSIDESEIQKLINDALRTVRNEMDERINAIKPQSINQEELTHSITDAVKRNLTTTFESVIRQSVAQAVSEQALNQNKDSIADVVAQLASLAQRTAQSEEELVTLKRAVNHAVQSMLDKVDASPAQPDQAALQKMTVLESTVQSLDAAIKALQSTDKTNQTSPPSSDNLQTLVFDTISAHASHIYKSLSPAVAADIDSALEKFSADRTNLVDYAISSSGGRVLASSASFELPIANRNPLLDLLTRVYVPHKTADEVIRDEMTVGSCWPMKGSKGGVLIQLRQSIVVDGFTLQHVSPAVSPDTTSMPRDVKFFGVPDANVEQVKSLLRINQSIHPSLTVPLGTFSYDRNGRQVQQWPTIKESRSFSKVLVEFESNYGSPSYTCVYRVRVHGKPAQ